MTECYLTPAAPDLLNALKECITQDGAPAFRSREYAERRLRAINDTALEAISTAKDSAEADRRNVAAMLAILKAIIQNGEFDSDGDFCIYRLEDAAYSNQPGLMPPGEIIARANAIIARAENGA